MHEEIDVSCGCILKYAKKNQIALFFLIFLCSSAYKKASELLWLQNNLANVFI